MDDLNWWFYNHKPGVYFLNHVILAERLRKILPWKLPKLVYEGTDYDTNTKTPEITEASVFGTSCELLYNDTIFNKVTFICFEDTQNIRLEFESSENLNFFPYQDFSFETIELSYELGYLIQEINL
jgi:hypothetical protein